MDIEVIKECTLLSDNLPFPEIVKKLVHVNIETYYTDLLAQTKTYYSKNEAHILPFSLTSARKVSTDFNADLVKQAVRKIQLGQIDYQEFLRQIMEAGVFSYSVFIKGRKAVYVGRLGEVHVELFPSQK